MKNKELQIELSKYPEDADVCVYEKGSVYDFPLSGIRESHMKDKSEVEIITLTGCN